MSHPQYARPQQPPQSPHTPISPGYHPTRQRQDHQPYSPQRSQTYDYRQPPPQHPLQQQRVGHGQHVQPPTQAQTQGHQRPQTQYVPAQPLYQPPYAQAVRSAPAPYAQQQQQQYQPHAQAPNTYMTQVQRTYSYPLPAATAQPQPPASHQAQYSNFYHAHPSAPPPAPLHQSQPPSQYARLVAHSSAAPSNATGRRPLPTPTQGTTPNASPGRARPISMPPPPTQNSYVAPPTQPFGHSSSSSLSHIVPQSSFPTTPSLPTASPITSSFLSRAASASPTRRPLPSPTPEPRPPVNTSAPTLPRSTNIQFGRAVSPAKHAQAGPAAVAPSQSSPPKPGLAQPPTSQQRRALPHSPTASPDLNQVIPGSGGLTRRGTVSQIVSKFSASGIDNRFGISTMPGAVPAKVTLPPAQAPVATSQYVPRSPVRASTLPSATNATPSSLLTNRQIALHEEQVDGGENDSFESSEQDDDASSGVYDEGTPAHGRTPSPQYGIRDLPQKPASGFGLAASNTKQATEPASPQYGIRDLPVRAKSILDRKRVWEKTGQDDSSKFGEGSKPSGSRSTFDVNKRSVPPSPTKISASIAPPVVPIAPSRSPQPQKPRQEQKLPMPVVRQPQPSRSERQPSWTLPTADLEKIQEKTHGGGQKPSMAFRMAAMSLAEESEADTIPVVGPQQIQPTRHPVQTQTPSSRSASPTKSYPFAPRTLRVNANPDLNLDDAPPPSLRRSPSPSPSTASSSVPSIPTIRTPDDGVDLLSGRHGETPRVMVPKINLPGDMDYNDDARSVHGHVPSIVVSPKPTSPGKAMPIINLPDDDEDFSGTGPMISVAAPPTIAFPPSMPVILNDLAASPSISSPTKSARSLPKPPGPPAPSVTSSSSSGSNVRSRGGGLVCGGCHQSIIGRIVSAMNLRWHPQCFKCCTCGELLEHISSYEHDGKPYCHCDYHELFAPRCYHCETPIIDERFITLDDPALGKRTYHEQHFFCAECGDPFLAPSAPSKSHAGHNEINIKGDGAFDLALDEDGDEVGFTVFRGHPYCEACHVRLRAPKCKGCKKSIRDGMRAVEALGGKWCFECFVCAGCQAPFEEPSFFQRDKKPFCESCFSIILRNEI